MHIHIIYGACIQYICMGSVACAQSILTVTVGLLKVKAVFELSYLSDFALWF